MEQRRCCGWRASASTTAACARWKMSASNATPAASMRCSAKTAPANPPSSRSCRAWFSLTPASSSSKARRSRFADPAAANRAGVVCIFQELSLLPDLTVADNICITNPPKQGGLIDGRRQNEIAAEMLARVGVDGHSSDVARGGPAAVAAAGGGDRQGARPQSEGADPRRSDVGARRCRRGQGLRDAEAASQRRPRDRLHLAPHARDRASLPTTARSTATGATSRPLPPAPRPTKPSSR